MQFDLDRNIDAAANDIQAAINAAAGQLPKDLPSPPTYRKVNPSDTPILILSVESEVEPIINVDDAGENILAQRISQISGVSLVRIGGQQQPAIRIQIDPAKLVEKNLQLEDIRSQIAQRHGRQSQGLDHRREAGVHDLRQRPADRGQALERRDRRLSQRRAGARARHRRRGRGSGRRPPSAPGATASASIFLVVFKQPGANVIKTVQSIKQTLIKLEASIPPDIHVKVLSDRTTTIRASVDDVQFTLLLDHRPGRDGHLRVPAQRLGDDHPEHHRAAGAARRVRADVGGELQPRQSFADGAHHRGRLRGRRRDRDARKHHPPHRGGHEAVSRRRSRAPAKSASRSFRSRSRWSRC